MVLKKFDEKILKVIVCPKTKTSLSYNKKTNELISKKARLAYPIINGVPILIVNKARRL